MSRPGSAQPIPPSVLGMAASRRSVLRGTLLGGALLSSSTLLAACGGDDGGGSADAAVKFGMNEAKGAGPAYERLVAMAEAYADKAGVTVERNEVDHNTFQENLNTYLQGNPDDVFTWFAGFRMNQLAEQGLISDVSEVWPIDGISDSFKEAATASDGKQYFVPKDYYPWAVFYKKSVFEKRGYAPPVTFDEFDSLMKKMQSDGLVPFAFADKDGWPAMGTFDILNMRINGFDFHMSLMAGEEDWDSGEVKQVFDTWRGLLPYHQRTRWAGPGRRPRRRWATRRPACTSSGPSSWTRSPTSRTTSTSSRSPSSTPRSAPPRWTPPSTGSASRRAATTRRAASRC